MNQTLANILIVAGSVLGGMGASLGVVWAIYTHKKAEAERRALAEAETSKTLEALQIDRKISKIVWAAVSKATEPLQAELHENTKITNEIDKRLTRVETIQFGGNGGGFREELNHNSSVTERLATDMVDVKATLAVLKASNSV